MNMETAKPMLVKGKNGLLGTISLLNDGTGKSNLPQNGAQQVQVELENGQRFVLPFEFLEVQADGTYYLPLDLAELQNRFGSGQGELVEAAQTAETVVIPVIAEEITIQKRQVSTGGVRLRKVVRQRDQIVDQPLLEEEVNVERVAINQAVEVAPAVRYEGDTMIVPVVVEEVVIQKRLILKEELRITKSQVTVSHPQTVKLRAEEIIVEQIESGANSPANNATAPVATSADEALGADFQQVQPTSSI